MSICINSYRRRNVIFLEIPILYSISVHFYGREERKFNFMRFFCFSKNMRGVLGKYYSISLWVFTFQICTYSHESIVSGDSVAYYLTITGDSRLFMIPSSGMCRHCAIGKMWENMLKKSSIVSKFIESLNYSSNGQKLWKFICSEKFWVLKIRYFDKYQETDIIDNKILNKIKTVPFYILILIKWDKMSSVHRNVLLLLQV